MTEDQGRELLAELAEIRKRLDRLENVPPTEPPPPVQPTWRDVTAECEWVDGRLVHNPPGEVTGIIVCGPDLCLYKGYRLTKISGPLTPHVAFIVEKQE